jgi:aminoglycoside phosphotransferase (APT) family kinase protein
MTEAVEHRLGPKQVAEVLARQFPELAIRNVQWLGAGLDSTAFDVNGEWVFRFPAREEIVAQMFLENRTLPVIGRAVSLPVPQFEWMGGPCEVFPFFFAGYAKLPGEPSLLAEPRTGWGRKLGRFLRQLHAIEAAKLLKLNAPVLEAHDRIVEFQEAALEDYAFVQDAAPETLPDENWRTRIEALPTVPAGEALVVTHGDLGAEHILHDERTGALTGVIDWSELGISDRAIDIAAIFHWMDEGLVEELEAAYGVGLDEYCLERARYYALCRGVMDIRFGIETERPEYVEAGARRMQFCASFRS